MEKIYSAWKIEQFNDHLFIDTDKSNNMDIGVNDMTGNDSEMYVRWKDEAWLMQEISVLRQPKWIQTRKGRVNEMGFQLFFQQLRCYHVYK